VYTRTFYRKKEDTVMPKKVTKRPSRKVRLYVWEGVLADYTPGIACAAARNVAEARKTIIDTYHNRYGSIASEIQRNPTKILDIPAAAATHGGG
jgi:hypothetical protein